MGVRTVVTTLLPGNDVNVVIECRQCGANVSSDPDECPECGGTEFCRFEIPT